MKPRLSKSQNSTKKCGISLLVLSFAAASYSHAQGPAISIDFLTKPSLIECEPGGRELCFRLNFGFVDGAGKAASVSLPAAKELARRIEIQADGQSVTPFYAAATANTNASADHLTQGAMLLFDVSGSMLNRDLNGQTRIEAAKSAAAEFLRNFTDGRDRVAIVPFASRNVLQTISSAHFVNTRAEAQAELDALPAPAARNNTALYSAVKAAVSALVQERHSATEQLRLIVLTDGSNDVQPQAGDDVGLLMGPLGLNSAAAAVEHSGVDVLPIGIGSTQSMDEYALARLGTRPPLITLNIETLRQAFLLLGADQMSNVTATIKAPENVGSRSLLAGRLLRFRAKLTLPDGAIVVENRPALWVAPPVATPSFNGEASEPEQRAYITNAHVGEDSAWLLARPLLVFAGFAAVLSFLWFGLPRWIWPERYDSRSARPLRPEYWPGSEAALLGPTLLIPRPPPPGFEPGGRQGRVPSRQPSENTIVRNAPDFASTKTRLNRS